jgi:very-short-patch-repair endonuclease
METRRFRFDYAMPEIKLAIEYEGIFSAKSRHTTVAGFMRDAVKYNEATILGWRVIRITADMINDNRALDYIQRAMGGLKCDITITNT